MSDIVSERGAKLPEAGDSASPSSVRSVVLSVRELNVEFRTAAGPLRAVNGLSYDLRAGEALAILGESGSGKSVSALAVMGLVPVPPGRVTGEFVRFEGIDLLTASKRVKREVRGAGIAMTFQDAVTSLNPAFTLGFQIGESLRTHRGISHREARKAAIALLDRVRIPDAARRVDEYPHQFSGGMRQRAMIAMAIALDPTVLIADEPTTALDVTVQAQILDLLAELRRDLGMAMIFVTHDLGVVAEMADRVLVMYAGRAVEVAPVAEFFAGPAHPYSRGLMASTPRVRDAESQLTPIRGTPPVLTNLPPWCEFEPRCEYSEERCSTEKPALRSLSESRVSACFFAERFLE